MGPAIALGFALLAQAAPDVDFHNAPDWVRLPSDQDLIAAYPAEARKRGVRGAAVLDCGLTDGGRLTDCQIAQESPPGYGFGAAALRVSTRFQMTAFYPDGRPVAGGRVQIPVHFGPPHH
jgi:protein TonB